MWKIINRLITRQNLRWLISRYRQMAIDERWIMIKLHKEGKREATELSIKEVAKYMAKEQILMEQLEKL